ncbi:MAG: hypothetical protein E4H15_08335 [Syntrophobacterales bacterium]|nr:MAG: hypothetical protein E4H15_08335 [Syntrophobacterales bacterium]
MFSRKSIQAVRNPTSRPSFSERSHLCFNILGHRSAEISGSNSTPLSSRILFVHSSGDRISCGLSFTIYLRYLRINEVFQSFSYIIDNTRRFNLREGLTPEEDGIPKRFFREPLPETQKIITEDQMKQLMDDYYRARGWNEKGEPPKSELQQ